MDKIFNKETIKYLKQFNVSPQEIARLQKEKLKGHALEVLGIVMKAIEEEDITLCAKYLMESPSGDGWGSDNTCVNFGTIIGGDEDRLDIRELFTKINNLNEDQTSYELWEL